MQFLSRLHRLHERGDTIVEVMVVLAVLGLGLSISYATASASLSNIRQADEHAQAESLVQTQAEYLYKLSESSTPDNTDPTSNIFLAPKPFCISDPTASNPILTYDSTIPTPFGDSGCNNFDAANLYTIEDYNCASPPAVTLPSVCPSNSAGLFIIDASWPSLDGNTDSATLTYQVHAPS